MNFYDLKKIAKKIEKVQLLAEWSHKQGQTKRELEQKEKELNQSQFNQLNQWQTFNNEMLKRDMADREKQERIQALESQLIASREAVMGTFLCSLETTNCWTRIIILVFCFN